MASVLSIRLHGQVPLCLLFAILLLCFCYSSQSARIFNSESWVDISEEDSNRYTQRGVPASNHWKDSGSEIFVGISEYRDKRCGLTLHNLFKKAKFPNRLRLGVVQQTHTEDDHFDCVKDYCALMGSRGSNWQRTCPHFDQIKTIVFAYLDSRGPMYARYQQQSMIQNEEFCMQIDAHTDMVSNWDAEIMDMWGSIGNEYAVLSTRLPDVDTLNNPHNSDVPHLCHATFLDSGAVRTMQPQKAEISRPLLAPFWAAGFSFSKCHMEAKVPYDPHLLYLYDGEEMTRFARMWTRGYDVYTPNKILFGHDYNDKMNKLLPSDFGATIKMEGGQKYEPDKNQWIKSGPTPAFRRRMYDDSINRMKQILGMVKNPSADDIALLTKYGLGSKRTLDALIQFTGIDFRSQVVFGDRCKQLQWVPFTPDSHPNVEDEDVWGNAPEYLVQGHASIPLLSGRHRIVEVPSPFSDEKVDPSGDNSNSNSRETTDISPEVELDISSGNPSVAANDVPAAHSSSWIDRISLGPVDWAVDWAVHKIDSTVASRSATVSLSTSHHKPVGHKMIKVMLLGLPLFVSIIWAATFTLSSGQEQVVATQSKRV